ncbi:MAG: hypothetical protein P8Y25_13820 [Chromatiaceae bacterium]|jgi:hypothetical protein
MTWRSISDEPTAAGLVVEALKHGRFATTEEGRSAMAELLLASR